MTLLAGTAISHSADHSADDTTGYCVPTRLVPFDTFMRDNLTVSVPLQVPVPEGYEVAGFGSQEQGYTYWMLPAEMAAAEKSHDLPAKTGYLYGKLSLDVGYDQKEDRFLGVDMDSAPAGVIAGVQAYRGNAGEYALMFMEVTMAKIDRKVWLVYVGLNLETMAAYLTYVPPGNDKKLGDCHWAAFRAAVNAVAVSPKTQEPLTK